MTHLVTISDMRKAGYCPTGARRWFEAHGLDFRDFLKHGIDIEVLRATGDAFAVRAIELHEARNGHGG
jgi:hypothetical protein